MLAFHLGLITNTLDFKFLDVTLTDTHYHVIHKAAGQSMQGPTLTFIIATPNFLLALVTLGEGWHNNHHYYMSSVRQGIRWWEVDITFYVLKALSWLGIARDLRPFRVLGASGPHSA